MSASCLYDGTIRHRRFGEVNREFSHRLALAYIDLDELPHLLGGRLVARRASLVHFRRGDYHGDPTVPLADAVRDTVLAQTGSPPAGPVRVLALPRILGYCFNPVSFSYCLERAADHPRALLAEVTNTPWGERHAYAMRLESSGSKVHPARFDKQLHVSPFMGMAYRYAIRLTAPAETLTLHIESRAGGRLEFDATPVAT